MGPNTQVMLSLTCSLPFVVTIIVFFPFSAWLLQVIRTPVLIRQYPCRTCTNFVNSLFILRRNSLCRTGKVKNKFCRETVVPRSLAQGCFESNLPLWSYSSFVAAAWEEWCVTIESLLLRQRTKHQFISLRRPPTFCDPTTGFPAKSCLRNKRRNSILMMHNYPDLSSPSDWLNQISLVARPIKKDGKQSSCCEMSAICSLAFKVLTP